MLGFLQLFARGLPYHIPCKYCNKLHSPEHTAPISAALYGSTEVLCLQADRRDFVGSIVGLHFWRSLFSMAMKLHADNLDCDPLLQLLS